MDLVNRRVLFSIKALCKSSSRLDPEHVVEMPNQCNKAVAPALGQSAQ